METLYKYFIFENHLGLSETMENFSSKENSSFPHPP